MKVITMLAFVVTSASYIAVAETNPIKGTSTPVVTGQTINGPKVNSSPAHLFGGYIVRPDTQKGEISYVNCQKRIPQSWIEEVAAYLRIETRFNIVCKDGTFDFTSPKIVGNATLFIIDDAKFPALLVAPENRWAVVNVATLANEQRPAFFQARTKKQLSRAFALLCGASNSQYLNSLTRGIIDESDLDKNLDYRLPLDVIMRFKTYMSTLGVTPYQQVTYRTACREGWAPAPTNEYQKAIWDKVHEIPKNPIKILPEPKPVKE